MNIKKTLYLNIILLIINSFLLGALSHALPVSKDSLRVPLGQKRLYERLNRVNNGYNGGYPDLSTEEFMQMSHQERYLAYLPTVQLIATGKIPTCPIPGFILKNPGYVGDLEDAGREALSAGASRFIETRSNGNKPTTFLITVIYNAMLKEAKKITKYETGSSYYMIKNHDGEATVNTRRNSHYYDLENPDSNIALAYYDREPPNEDLLYKLEKLENLMKFLKPSQQAAFILRHYRGLKLREIASLFRVSINAVDILLKDANKRIKKSKEATGLLEEIGKTKTAPEAVHLIANHFSEIIENEIQRVKNNSNSGNARPASIKFNLPLVSGKEDIIPELLELSTISRKRDLEGALMKYMEFSGNLKVMGIDKGFNSYLDIMSFFVAEGEKKIRSHEKIRAKDLSKAYPGNRASFSFAFAMTKLLNIIDDSSIASPFMIDYRKTKGILLEDIQESEIKDLVGKFPVNIIQEKALERLFRLYIAHARIMKKLGIVKGRTMPEDVMSAFINTARNNSEVTVPKLAGKCLSTRESLMTHFFIIAHRLEESRGAIDIFAATKKEEAVFKKAFLNELSGMINELSIEASVLIDYRGIKGLPLEGIEEDEIPYFIERFPDTVIPQDELDRLFRLYIAHVRVMKNFGVIKGRTIAEDAMSSFIKLARENKKVEIQEIANKASLTRTQLTISLYDIFHRRMEGETIVDIFAATGKEKKVFREEFLGELSSLYSKALSDIISDRIVQKALATNN